MKSEINDACPQPKLPEASFSSGAAPSFKTVSQARFPAAPLRPTASGCTLLPQHFTHFTLVTLHMTRTPSLLENKIHILSIFESPEIGFGLTPKWLRLRILPGSFARKKITPLLQTTQETLPCVKEGILQIGCILEKRNNLNSVWKSGVKTLSLTNLETYY